MSRVLQVLLFYFLCFGCGDGESKVTDTSREQGLSDRITSGTASERSEAESGDIDQGRSQTLQEAVENRISPEDMKQETAEKIDLAAQYFASNINEEGRFNYRRYAEDESFNQSKAYNLLRHAGTVYAMGQYQEFSSRVNLGHKVVLAANYLKDCCLAPMKDDEDQLMIWSRGEMVGSGPELRGKLGALGLGLLSFIAAKEEDEDFITSRELTAVGNAILAMQEEDGFFHSIYQGPGKGFDQTFKSLYYPGEAILGLFNLYQLDRDERWLEAGLRALRYISNKRKNQAVKSLPKDHWILLATTELFENVEERYYAEDKDLFMTHAERIIQSMLASQRLSRSDGVYFGSFNRRGNTTPIGTRLEGMISYGPFIRDASLSTDVKNSCQVAIDYLLDASVEDGPCRGGVTYSPKRVRTQKGKRTRKDVLIQIDNVQHVTSGWIWSLRRRGWLYGS